ncbi:MAG: phosphoenolpyruvate synthase [Candidatus Bathyarchaeota archaeon B24]|nr:MAG: phosphoenolpyruvate synthase [Candidatus Bathyarchaeota archaeon B24]
MIHVSKDKATALILWFEELRKDDVPLVGGKCANLGEMINAGIPVPPGFAVSAYAYKRFLELTGIAEKVYTIIRETVKDVNDPQQYQEASKKIRQLIESTPIPEEIEKAIREAYRKLNAKLGMAEAFVAVRSSATAEDLPGSSFAGQQETFLNVRGEDDLIHYVRRCWSSLFTPRAIFYRTQRGFPHEKVLISVAVQKMVNSKAAGVMFTLHPVTGDRSKIVIEASWGLGEAVVSGSVTPDRFVVDKDTLEVLSKEIADKTVEYVRDPETGKTIHAEVPPERRKIPCLTDEEIKRLAELAKRIEQHYGTPQDIEFAIDKDLPFPENVFIVQSRPETVWSVKAEEKPVEKAPAPTEEFVPVIKGLPASPGIYAGRVKVVLNHEEAAKLMEEGDILVTKMTNPDWVPYMRMAGAIVTDDGGMTCHAAIVSRELGIPCIVGTREATKVLKTGTYYTVDATSGVVYEGIVESLVKPKREAVAAAPGAVAALPQWAVYPPVTATKIYVNLSIPDVAEKVFNESHPDGVGLLRAEHLMLSVGKHPRLLIEEGGAEKMVNAFAEGIRKVAQVFFPRPVVYRFLDFKPDEFLSLPGGEKYEEEAGHVGPNPLIGYRGAFRYIKEPDIFRLECRAIRKVREEYGLKNVWVMVPFVRRVEEFKHCLKIMEEEGLRKGPDFKVWIMVEVPSTVLLIDKFIEAGIDGVSFGTNDLTMLILGIDRDDASVQEIYDERNLAVLRALSHVIRICREHGVTTSICGQAPSNYPEIVEFLVKEGVTSLSVNPDKVMETRMLVASIERKVLLERLARVEEQGKAQKRFFQPRWAEELG